jgi:tRNA (guanine10-N2)-dimethyltransferase
VSSGVYVLELVGEDDAFATREAASSCSGTTEYAPGLAIAGSISRIESLAYTRRASEFLGHTAADIDDARTLLRVASIDRTGTVAVRARDMRGTAGIDTQRAEREIGSVLTERGFAVDLDEPDHELRALFSGDTCALGWLAERSVRDYGKRKPSKRPFFQPGSMDPLLARALVNIAGTRPGARVLDPMCGTGGILIEAGLAGADVIGLDAQPKMVRGARENLAQYLGYGEVVTGSATRLPFRTGSIDAVVFDAPYGRQSKIVDTPGDESDPSEPSNGLEQLVTDALAEARRVASRAVLVGDRQWDRAAKEAGWSTESVFQRRVHRSLTRHILILD